MDNLSPKKIGVPVCCIRCHQMKTPRGRSMPGGAMYCDRDCPGYDAEPHVGSLWPGESEADFGYPVPDVGTVIRG